MVGQKSDEFLVCRGEPLEVFEDRKFKYGFGDKRIQMERFRGRWK